MDSAQAAELDRPYEELPAEQITIDQVVAYNLRYWRRAAGMTQEQLGQRIGMSAANVSGAERSAGTDRERRRFDAHTLAAASFALGVPIVAMFLPPADDGDGKRYTFRPDEQGGEVLEMADLMAQCLADPGGDTPAMATYRKRIQGAVASYLDTDAAEQIAWALHDATSTELAAVRAHQLRVTQAELLRAAGQFADIAAVLEQITGEGQK